MQRIQRRFFKRVPARTASLTRGRPFDCAQGRQCVSLRAFIACGVKHCAALVRRKSSRSSLWFLFAEFLEARIVAQRIEHWIEPEQRGSERYKFGQRATGRD